MLYLSTASRDKLFTIQSPTRPFQLAARNWKTIWDAIRSAAPVSEWEKLGFPRSAEAYYEAVVAILDLWDRKGGVFPGLRWRGDGEKGEHLRTLFGS
jgi:hypothetical protein